MPIAASVLDAPTVQTTDPLPTGPIIVATDGGEDSDGALRVAWASVGCTGADVQIVSIIPLLAPVVELTAMAPLPESYWQARRDAQLAAVRAQLARTLPPGCDWPIAAVEGYAGEDVARLAHERGARLIVTGRGRHGLAHRLAAPEAVLRILRLVDIPVLAVDANASTLPRRIVIATDFTPYSAYAARVALSIAAPDAIVYLAHVRPRPLAAGPAYVVWERAYESALPGFFQRFRESLGTPPEMTLETITLSGDPGTALVDLATTSCADLVVSGTHGRGFFHRLLIGSVAVDLLRGAPCSLLCVPGSARTHASARTEALAQLRRRTVAMQDVARELAAFSRRARGRAGSLELKPAGAERMVIAASATFVGADYDRHDDAVMVMLGAIPPDGQLSHVARGVRSVDLLSDDRGVDRGFIVTSTDGTTALHLHP